MKVLIALALLAFISLALGSSHSEAPGTASIPNADITDLYVFNSYETGRSAYITFLMNTYPLQTPYGGPNYYSLSTSHFYEIYVDRDSDGSEDYTFQWIYGNSLPSSTATGFPWLYPEDPQCVTTYTRNTTPIQPPSAINQGIALNIAGNSIRIALKVAGFITNSAQSTSNMGNLNWEEYYFLNLLSGPLRTATMTNLTSGGNIRMDKPFDYAGENSFGSKSDYESYSRQFIHSIDLGSVMSCGGGATGKVWVGQREDPFYIALGRIFDYLNLIPVVHPAFSQFTIADCLTNNDLREKNVATFALEVPISCFNAGPNGGVLNVWAGTRQLFHNDNDLLKTSHIAGQQVSRMGNPLVNELVIGLLDKNRFTRQHPTLDADSNYGFVNFVLYPTIPEIINIRYRAAVNQILGANLATLAPSTPRMDLFTVFLTGIPGVNKGILNQFAGEVMRINTTIPAVAMASQNPLGIAGTIADGSLTDFAGFPNGRRPGDDVTDIALMAMTGILCTTPFVNAGVRLCAANATFPIGSVPLRDGAPVKATYYQNRFPYFNTPTPGSYLDGGSNVVQNATFCYPAAQHGRCPIPTPSSTPTPCPSSSSTLGGFVFSLFSLF